MRKSPLFISAGRDHHDIYALDRLYDTILSYRTDEIFAEKRSLVHVRCLRAKQVLEFLRALFYLSPQHYNLFPYLPPPGVPIDPQIQGKDNSTLLCGIHIKQSKLKAELDAFSPMNALIYNLGSLRKSDQTSHGKVNELFLSRAMCVIVAKELGVLRGPRT